jgi:hypothetical protein
MAQTVWTQKVDPSRPMKVILHVSTDIITGMFLMVAGADHPEGPFTALGPREMGTANGFASDMNECL